MFTPKLTAVRRWCALACALVAVAAIAVTVTATAARAVAATVVSLTFDDGHLNQYTNAGPLLAARGMAGTFYVNSGRVGTPGFMTRGQLADLAAAGNEVGGHTLDHADLPTMSTDDQRRQICNDRVALLNMGFAVKSLAYPYGSANATTRQIAVECGYNSARAVGGVVSPGSCQGCPYAESVPPANAYFTQTPDSIKTDTTLTTLKGYVTQAEEHGGGWVQLVMHHVCDGCGGAYEISPSTLSAFLDWLAQRAPLGTTVKTVDEVIGGSVQPGVPGPPLPPSPDGNLVQNASLESVGVNGLPTCFQFGGFGTNTFAWTRVTDAHTGSYAQQVSVSAYTTGDRKLVTRQDTSSCVVAATPGRTYRVSVWYKGTWSLGVPVRLTLYYRNSAGSWVYWTSGPAVPATGAWTQTPAYTTPPVPVGATALSFGLAIAGPGTLLTDDYALSDTAAS